MFFEDSIPIPIAATKPQSSAKSPRSSPPSPPPQTAGSSALRMSTAPGPRRLSRRPLWREANGPRPGPSRAEAAAAVDFAGPKVREGQEKDAEVAKPKHLNWAIWRVVEQSHKHFREKLELELGDWRVDVVRFEEESSHPYPTIQRIVELLSATPQSLVRIRHPQVLSTGKRPAGSSAQCSLPPGSIAAPRRGARRDHRRAVQQEVTGVLSTSVIPKITKQYTKKHWKTSIKLGYIKLIVFL